MKIENRDHFRAYVRGLIGELIATHVIGAQTPPLDILTRCAEQLVVDLARDAVWAGKQVGAQLAMAGLGTAQHAAARHIDQAERDTGVPFARAAKTLLEDVGNLVTAKLREIVK